MRNGALADPAVRTVWVNAMFVSNLQPSDNPTGPEICAAVTHVLRTQLDSYAAAVAYEFGQHPDDTMRRFSWCRDCVDALVPARAPDPADA